MPAIRRREHLSVDESVSYDNTFTLNVRGQKKKLDIRKPLASTFLPLFRNPPTRLGENEFFQTTKLSLPMIGSSQDPVKTTKEPRKHARTPTNTEHVAKKKQKNVRLEYLLASEKEQQAANEPEAPVLTIQHVTPPKSNLTLRPFLHYKLNKSELIREILIQVVTPLHV